MITKGPLLEGDEVTVTFTLPISDRRVAVAGDFNQWRPDATPLIPHGDTASATAVLPVGRRYAFRYVDQDGHWFDDDDADDVEANLLGGTNGVVDLTALLLDEATVGSAPATPAGSAAGWLWPIEKAVQVATAPVARVTRLLRRCP